MADIKLKPCVVCDGKIVPIWYVVRVSQAMIQTRTANQVLGLAQMIGGNLALGEVMAPEPECVIVMGDADPSLMTEFNVCQNCFLMKEFNLALMMGQ